MAVLAAGAHSAAAFTFPSIDGGQIDLEAWKNRPVLVVNTASLCGFTYQYDGLQALYDRYRDRGLIVLAVPSNNFRQELASGDQVKEFCAVNFNLDIPMATITDVKGPKAHPFYKNVRSQTGFVPRWNFNKVLIDGNGDIVETYSSGVKPLSRTITSKIEALLPKS